MGLNPKHREASSSAASARSAPRGTGFPGAPRLAPARCPPHGDRTPVLLQRRFTAGATLGRNSDALACTASGAGAPATAVLSPQLGGVAVGGREGGGAKPPPPRVQGDPGQRRAPQLRPSLLLS